MVASNDAVIISSVGTPFGKIDSILAALSAPELGRHDPKCPGRYPAAPRMPSIQ